MRERYAAWALRAALPAVMAAVLCACDVPAAIDPTGGGESCDTACADGQVCSAGECMLVCSGGTTKCGDACVDTDNDPSNCGGCGNICEAGQASWKPGPSMPTARSGVVVGAVDGILYAIGGDDGTKLGINEAYDPMTKNWKPKAPMPTARSFGSTNAAAAGGLLYLVGGYPSSGCAKTVEAYDPESDSWEGKAPMPTARCLPAVAAQEGRIYAAGGTNASGSIKYALVEVYDVAGDTWTSAPSMITCRQAPAAAAVGGKLYVIGGWAGPSGSGQCQTGNASLTVAVNEVFDPVTGMWTSKAPMPTPRYSAGIAVHNGKIYVIGGTNDDVVALSTNESYDPSTDTWSTELAMPTSTGAFGAATLGNLVYVAGGNDFQSNILSTLDIFVPVVPPTCVTGMCN